MKIVAFVSIMLIAATGLFSCSPSATDSIKQTTLLVTPSGSIQLTSTDRLYTNSLSCGCPFILKVTSADTTDGIVYEFPDFGDTIRIHTVRAKVSSPTLSKGIHVGSLSFQTVQPLTTELLTHTYYDTIVVP